MSHLAVPHTIIRGSTYHFNLRHNSSIVRRSLHTSCRVEALELVSKILGEIGSQGRRSNMEKVVLDKLVRETIRKHLQRVGCLFGEKNSYGDMLLTYYQNESIHQQFTYMYESDTSLPSYHQYKIQECFPTEPPSASVSNISYNLFIEDREDPDAVPTPDIVDFDKNFFEMEEKLEIFFRQIERIKRLLKSGNFETAKSSYCDLKKKQERALSFSAVSELFLKAGKEGKLPITKSYKGEPWKSKILKDNERSFNIFNAHFGEQMIHEIDSDELDFFFREILANYPKGNISPYNTMKPSELIECAVNGEVEKDQVIAGKNVFEHFKKLQTFFNFYERELSGSSQAIRDMRHKVRKDTNTRGQFSKNQVSKILEFIDSLDEKKKWPVNVMAFTGMRNAEVMQLRKEDVMQSEEGIWYFRVTEDAGKLKTKQSNRIIPIHDLLLEKGFLDFVCKCSETYLFKRYSQSEKYLTRLYSNHIRPNCNLPNENENGEILNLYSLRHFVVSSLVDENSELKAPEAYIQAMLGHLQTMDKSVTTRVYTHADNMRLKQKLINLITLKVTD